MIDVQNEYFTGDLPIEYPNPQETIVNIGVAMDAACTAGIPVIVVQQTSPTSSPLFAIGTDSWQLHPVVASRNLILTHLPCEELDNLCTRLLNTVAVTAQ